MKAVKDDVIRIAGTTDDSVVDGPGYRYTVWFQGCSHHCPGCHNPGTWDFNKGTLVTVDSILQEIGDNPLLSGVTLSGGDPFDNAKAAKTLAQAIKSTFPHMDIWCYSGYTYEELFDRTFASDFWELLKLIDVLVDGPYIEAQRDLSLSFRGSRNQRIINIPRTIKEHKIVELGLEASVA